MKRSLSAVWIVSAIAMGCGLDLGTAPDRSGAHGDLRSAVGSSSGAGGGPLSIAEPLDSRIEDVEEDFEEEEEEDLDDEEVPPSACEQAASGDCEACMACAVADPCRTELSACKADAACVTLVDCYDACERETDAVRTCHASCDDAHPGGLADAQGLLACLDEACGRVCG